MSPNGSIYDYYFPYGTTTSTTSTTFKVSLTPIERTPEQKAEDDHRQALTAFLSKVVGDQAPWTPCIVRALVQPECEFVDRGYSYQAVRNDEDDGWIVEMRNYGSTDPLICTWDFDDWEFEDATT
jgi:hypothetical protein